MGFSVFPLVLNNDAAIVAHVCYISLLDVTITTSNWLVNRKTFVNDTFSSKGLRTTIWRVLGYFVEDCFVAT